MMKTFDVNRLINVKMDINMEEHNTVLNVNNFYQGFFSKKERYRSLYPKREVHSRGYIDTSTIHP
jgi:hypothetical protein